MRRDFYTKNIEYETEFCHFFNYFYYVGLVFILFRKKDFSFNTPQEAISACRQELSRIQNLKIVPISQLVEITSGWNLLHNSTFSFLRVYERMKRSDNVKKFFTILLFLTLLVYQYIDFHIASDFAHNVRMMIEYANENHVLNTAGRTAENTVDFTVLYPYFTKPFATLTASFISFMFLYFKSADKILTTLHNNKRFFLLTGVASMAITILLSRWFIFWRDVGHHSDSCIHLSEP